MTTAIEEGEGSASLPGRSLPPEKSRYPLYRRLGGPQGRSGQVRKISPPRGFDPRTVEAIGESEINHIFWILRIRHFIAESITFNIGYDVDVIGFTFKCTDG